MPYGVIWLSAAQQRLAHIWLQASDRRAVTATADGMERLLQTAPAGVGSRLQGPRRYRWLRWAPLEVLYLVSPGDRMVLILQVVFHP
jgi:plasmid stabilization system protein ParE